MHTTRSERQVNYGSSCSDAVEGQRKKQRTNTNELPLGSCVYAGVETAAAFSPPEVRCRDSLEAADALVKLLKTNANNTIPTSRCPQEAGLDEADNRARDSCTSGAAIALEVAPAQAVICDDAKDVTQEDAVVEFIKECKELSPDKEEMLNKVLQEYQDNHSRQQVYDGLTKSIDVNVLRKVFERLVQRYKQKAPVTGSTSTA